MKASTRPCVLVFAGHDPSGGAGIQADIEAIAAQGAHALPVITALTVQDNDHAYAVHAVDVQIILQQAMTLVAKMPVKVVKLGIVAHKKNATAIASFIENMKQQQPDLQVIVDPVLGSGHGDSLSLDDAVVAIQPLLKVATLVTPNLPELKRLSPKSQDLHAQVGQLMQDMEADVLLKGGHANEAMVRNIWFQHGQWQTAQEWQWPRLPGEFHGSGCTLASAIAGQLACGADMGEALGHAQAYTQQSLQHAYAIAAGQLIPARHAVVIKKSKRSKQEESCIN
ncbi:hydroxymethylpyrimidine/phosphomethylpyrimidine kinase [Undibacterium sp. TS12]|uniref:bifunctional hydroxymethylpyrimidine kinase/phosphomethylpyrimidine kinase n=1 Tax=Undibacterium sp. TS12 TaxID=2908202 RepID=UPI001F4D1815|nr:hydroxymethylpyrimidine/phosphomethylpyrimidine kinase [Undibacterium sp. TS12]MCH8619670.1 hydroxymethylpyrimidine/phosphomethylpyrimidine kinase [Undibacterium sp. TS12]